MVGTREGAIKVAAKKIGMSVEEYLDHQMRGEKWCSRCTTWKPLVAFGYDKSRSDGREAKCFDCRHRPRASKKGLPSPHRGRVHSLESRRNMSKARRGNKNRLGKPFTSEQLAYLRQRTIEHTARGERHPHWKGGITPENEHLRHSLAYAEWRKAIFTRDNYTCTACGDSKGGNLNAHHVLPWAQYPQYRFDVNNGITLCESCHAKFHQKPDSVRKRRKAKKGTEIYE